MLIILAGLPGVGKTSIAKALAQNIKALHLRIDSIEQALRNSGIMPDTLYDKGYHVAYAIAEDNLQLGLTVIADSVNPLNITRKAWRTVAQKAGVLSLEIEIICSNQKQHKQQIETRHSDIDGLTLPDWATVMKREYNVWTTTHNVVDTAGITVTQAVAQLLTMLPAKQKEGERAV